jgi:hypothetical protein
MLATYSLNKKNYNANLARENHVDNKQMCCAKCKTFLFKNEINFVEEQVIKKKWSPQVATKSAGITSFTDRTVYNCIEKGQTNIKPHHLRHKLRRKRYQKYEIKETAQSPWLPNPENSILNGNLINHCCN